MSAYFLPEQIKRLLSPIDPARVGKDKRNNAHVEAYEIRAHLNRVFGFGRWSGDTLSMECVSERSKDDRYWAVYLAQYRLTINAPDGGVLCTYTEWATGKSDNQPSHGDCVDMAVKTAESQALKRAAMNLGDQFGLGLYNGGKLTALVARSVSVILAAVKGDGVKDDAKDDLGDLTSHLTDPLPPEENLEFADKPAPEEPRVTSTPKDQGLAALVAQAEQGPAQDVDIKQFYAKLRARAAAVGVKGMLVGETGLSLGSFIDLKQRERLDAR